MDITDQIQLTRQFVVSSLPKLNSRVLRADLTVGEFCYAIAPFFKLFCQALIRGGKWWRRPTLLAIPSRAHAKEALQALGFLASSLERHAQAQGIAPGSALGEVPSAVVVMQLLGYVAGTVARDTAYSFWIENPRGLSFTDDEGEAAFRRAVCDIDKFNRRTVDLLRPLVQLDVPVSSESAAHLIAQASAAQKSVSGSYRSLAEKRDGKFILTPEFFTTNFRTWLCTYTINGEVLKGPNAAYLSSQGALDAISGFSENWHLTGILEEACRYIPQPERETLRRDIALPNLAAVLSTLSLKCDVASVPNMSESDLVVRFTRLSESEARVFNAWFDLRAHMFAIRKTHRAFVKHWLEDVADKLDPKTAATLPVPPTEGTGGSDMQKLDRIVQMIGRNEIISKLEDAFRMAWPKSSLVQQQAKQNTYV